MRKHEIWLRLGHGKGDLCTIESESEDGTRRSYRGKVLGWTRDNQLVLEVIVYEDGEPVRKKYGISPEGAQRAYVADRKKAERERLAALPTATGPQVKYALALLERVTDEEWATIPQGAHGQERPSEDMLWTLPRMEVSELIDELKNVEEWRQ